MFALMENAKLSSHPAKITVVVNAAGQKFVMKINALL